MTFATWWRGDVLPNLSPLPTFSAHCSTDIDLVARLTNRSPQDITTRVQSGNRPYLAFMEEVPVAYGWAARQEGSITDLQWSFAIAPGNSYLHSFQTFPQWRGRGIYPHLLQSIIDQEQHIDRFWIGYMPDNRASERGIQKAGFQPVSDLVVSERHIRGLTLFEASVRAQVSAEFFQLPIADKT